MICIQYFSRIGNKGTNLKVSNMCLNNTVPEWIYIYREQVIASANISIEVDDPLEWMSFNSPAAQVTEDTYTTDTKRKFQNIETDQNFYNERRRRNDDRGYQTVDNKNCLPFYNYNKNVQTRNKVFVGNRRNDYEPNERQSQQNRFQMDNNGKTFIKTDDNDRRDHNQNKRARNYWRRYDNIKYNNRHKDGKKKRKGLSNY